MGASTTEAVGGVAGVVGVIALVADPSHPEVNMTPATMTEKMKRPRMTRSYA
jgi:hypothetical protein